MKRATQVQEFYANKGLISIHALVKRATRRTTPQDDYLSISIHALVKRATGAKSPKRLRKHYFNPRPREEGDKNTMAKMYTLDISIHALVKRATFLRKKQAYDVTYFNPRPREEGDSPALFPVPINPNFNPRPREEGD